MLNAFWIVVTGMLIIFAVLGILYLVMIALIKFLPAREAGQGQR